MANSNFVVHNGLTVGPTTIDAASGNVTIPVGKMITIGNVLLRDNGNGQLAIRDITDNSDAIVNATLDSGSQTLGNIQIGTNHIESINANGLISLRPNGAGNIAFAANTIMLGKGGAFTLISTGEQTSADLGINYTPSNIIVQTTGALSSGNVRVSMTTPSTTTATGALQVLGGVGIRGNLNIGSLAIPGALHTIIGNVDVSGAGTEYFNIGGNIMAIQGSFGSINSTGFINTTANVSAAVVNTGALNATGTTTLAAVNSSGFINTSGNVSAAILNSGAINSTGFINTSGNVSAAVGSFDSITVRAAVTAIANGGTSGVGNIGATGATFNTIFAKATTAQYADLAEKYLADAEYSPGTVVHFGGEKEVSICDVDMCSRVAGVVSTQPGYVMNEGLSGEHVVILALTGRVPTKVRGPIRKGDLMVSAGDGHARAEGLPQVGTVIGKALEDFDGDSGVIEVVVGKH